MVERGNACAKIPITWGRNIVLFTGGGGINNPFVPKYLPSGLQDTPNSLTFTRMSVSKCLVISFCSFIATWTYF